MLERFPVILQDRRVCVSYRYDDDRRLIEMRLPTGLSYHYRYDLKGRCVETWGAYPNGVDPALFRPARDDAERAERRALRASIGAAEGEAVILVVGRLVQGAGAAALLPSSLGLLLAAFGPERRSQMVALWAGVGALAVATGPSLGAALITAGGWRWAFFVNLPVGAVAFVTGHENPTKPHTNLDWAALARFPGTLVVYMGMARLDLIVKVLLEHGKPPDTPAALVQLAAGWPFA